MISERHISRLKTYFVHGLLVIAVATATGRMIARSDLLYAGPYMVLAILLSALAWARLDLAVAFWILTYGIFTFETDLPSGVPNFYYHQLILMVLVAVWFLKSNMIRDLTKRTYLWRSPLTKAMFIWLLWCALSGSWVAAGARLDAGLRDQLYGMIALLALVGGYLIVAKTVTTRKQLKLILFALVITGLIQSGFFTYLTTHAFGVSFEHGNLQAFQEYRWSRGNFFIVCPSGAEVPLLMLAAALISYDTRVKVLGLAYYLFGWCNALLSGSRGWIISILVTTLMMVSLSRKYLLLVVLVGAFAVGITVYFPWLQDYYVQHPGLAQASGRFGLWKDGVRIVSEQPLFGVGFFNYVTYREPVEYLGRTHTQDSVHHPLIQIAVENGIPALISMLFVIGFAILESWRLYTTSNDKLFRILGLSVTVMGIWQFIDGGLLPAHAGQLGGLFRLRELPAYSYVWIYFGLVVAARGMQESQRK